MNNATNSATSNAPDDAAHITTPPAGGTGARDGGQRAADAGAKHHGPAGAAGGKPTSSAGVPASAAAPPDPQPAELAETPLVLQIMGSEYRVACPANEQHALTAAAQHLDETMQGIRNTGKVIGVERIAVMAALNISYELLQAQQQSSRLESTVNERVKRLLEQTDQLLSQLQQNGV